MSNTVNALGAILDIETPAAQFEDSRVVLSGARHGLKQRNPRTASVNEQSEDAGALVLGTLWCLGKFQNSIRP